MRLKYIKYALLCTTLSLASCNDWLTVEPDYEVTDTDLYKNTAGYHKALNGLYFQLSAPALYGEGLSWGFVEAWARTYKFNESQHQSYYQFYHLNYDQKNAMGQGKESWLAAFTTVAQANDLIAHTLTREASFFTNGDLDRNLILGEAYAVRALMHFEMVRLYAQAPVLEPNGVYVPYVTEYPSIVNPPLPTSEVLAKAIADFEQARELVGKFDLLPANLNGIINTDRFFGTIPVLGKFYGKRGMRMNYLAITGMLARCCLYAGDEANRQKALTYANELIQLVTDKKLKFALNNTIVSQPKMISDLLFAAYNEKLWASVEPNISLSSGVESGQSQILYVDDLSARKGDKRSGFFSTQDPVGVLLKHKSSSSKDQEGMLLPNLRLSEMYYIAAECLAESDMKAAVQLLVVVRKARGLYASLSTSMSMEQFTQELVKEYRLDLIGEGQVLFMFKRKNLPIKFSDGEFIHNGKLVIPVPDIETPL